MSGHRRQRHRHTVQLLQTQAGSQESKLLFLESSLSKTFCYSNKKRTKTNPTVAGADGLLGAPFSSQRTWLSVLKLGSPV